MWVLGSEPLWRAESVLTPDPSLHDIFTMNCPQYHSGQSANQRRSRGSGENSLPRSVTEALRQSLMKQLLFLMDRGLFWDALRFKRRCLLWEVRDASSACGGKAFGCYAHVTDTTLPMGCLGQVYQAEVGFLNPLNLPSFCPVTRFHLPHKSPTIQSVRQTVDIICLIKFRYHKKY